MQYDELGSCTFTPIINKKSVSSDRPVIVRGLGRFLELRQMQKQIEEEKRQREEKAFAVRYVPKSHTIPEPFQLSSQNSNLKKRREERLKILQNAQERECTFHPKTLEGTNRQLIRQVLKENENLSRFC